MEFNQQIYRAPSIPKLGKRNVSSSVLRSASKISAASPTPKLRVSRAKFTGRQEPIAEAVVSNAQALTETNLILVEIQKQLSLDFAMRIAEERETIKRMKAAESRRRFGAEEKAVEGTGKLGKGIGKVFNKVVSPAKSIFSKIIDFFSIILTGIVFNNAFKWLQDKNNREKVLGVINWVTKHWKELLGVFIGVKVFGFLYKLISFAKFVSGFFGGRGRGRGPGGRGPRGGPYDPRGPLGSCGPVLKCLDKIKGPQLEALADKLAKTKRFSPLFSQSPGSETTSGKTPWWNNALTILGTVIDVASLISLFAPIPGGRPISVLLKALRGSLIFKGVRRGVQAANQVGNTVKRTNRGVQRGLGVVEKAKQNRSSYALQSLDKSRTGRGPTYEELSSVENTAKSAAQDALKRQKLRGKPEVTEGVYEEVRPGNGGGRRFNRGGIIPGPRVNKDVTPFMGTPGERVVPLSARGFFPFVDDIIFNGGKMWEMFSGAIKKLFLITRRQEETSRKFGEVTEKLDKNLKVEKQKAAIKSLTGGIGGGSRASSFNVRPKPVPTLSSNSSRSGGVNLITLPPMVNQSAPPTIPTPQAPATEAMLLSSVNSANPYMTIAQEFYGIFV